MDQSGNSPSSGGESATAASGGNPYRPIDPAPDAAQIVTAEVVAPQNLPVEMVSRPLRIWPTLTVIPLSLLTFMVTSFVMLLVGVIVVHGRLPIDRLQDPAMLLEVTQSRLGFPLVVVVPQLALIIPCLLAALLSPVATTKRLGLVRGHWPFWAWVAAMLATPLIGMLSGLVASQFMEESEHLKELGGIFKQHGTSGFLIPLALMIGLTPAICEELLFRGYVQTRLTRSLGSIAPRRGWAPVWSIVGALAGVLIASVCFAAFHWDFVHIITVFPIGLFLGWVAYQSGSLFPAMLGHFLNNALSVVMMVNAPEEADMLGLPSLLFAMSVLGLGALGMLGVVVASFVYPAMSKRNPPVGQQNVSPDIPPLGNQA